MKIEVDKADLALINMGLDMLIERYAQLEDDAPSRTDRLEWRKCRQEVIELNRRLSF